MELEAVRHAVAASGLSLRGGFHPSAEDGVPLLKTGAPARTLLLLGNVDDGMWQAFRASPEGRDGGSSHAHPLSDPDLGPLDRWSRRVITGLAEDLGAEPVFPFGGPPYFPFQAWARKSEPVWPSPLGLLVQRDYGLWHAYRGALCFAARIALPPRDDGVSPCLSCSGQPCLSACPVSAFSGQGYDVAACAAHIAGPEGRDCMELGCRARRACPVGSDVRYQPEQAAFHMRAFLSARP
ncbi:hypothetical protein [Denitrobaculum tricleocarpae]|uniref:4Fe-4S ferredoxin-type domain-containing protein n=1 Tax=Denitrobaculum tricleocarpae TaxID=2591009 RepID=A0A545TKK6_9PROT|nr:hypothetical protein [Denitrobaculum tricleocarpae]TQV77728.1 hypothetical protein FKG95_19380 [Denitrobaculum tricleocarpae]